MAQLAQIAEAQIVALCDPSREQVEHCRRQFPHLSDLPVFEDYRQMLENNEIDAVEISTPHNQHFNQLVHSFASGKHVFVEKPFVSNPTEAAEAIKARDRSGKIGLLAYQRHTQAEFRWIRQRILSGALGEVQGINALLCQEWKRFTEGSWRQDPAQSCGGMLNDSGSHILDVLHWCTGLEPESVSSYGDNRGAPVDINSAITIRFRNGAIGTVTVMGDAQHWLEDLTIWCERGSFLLRNGKLTLVENDGSKIHAEDIRGGSNPDANFIAAIQGKEEVHSPFEAALPVLKLTAAVYESMSDGGRPVAI